MALGLKATTKLTKALMQCEIDDLVGKKPEFEHKVREMADEMTRIYNEKTDQVAKDGEKTDQVADTHDPQTPQTLQTNTPLIPYPLEIASIYESTQDDSREPDESELKRKLNEETEDEEDEENERKRPRTTDVTTAAMTELTKAINKDRAEGTGKSVKRARE